MLSLFGIVAFDGTPFDQLPNQVVWGQIVGYSKFSNLYKVDVSGTLAFISITDILTIKEGN